MHTFLWRNITKPKILFSFTLEVLFRFSLVHLVNIIPNRKPILNIWSQIRKKHVLVKHMNPKFQLALYLFLLLFVSRIHTHTLSLPLFFFLAFFRCQTVARIDRNEIWRVSLTTHDIYRMQISECNQYAKSWSIYLSIAVASVAYAALLLLLL